MGGYKYDGRGGGVQTEFKKKNYRRFYHFIRTHVKKRDTYERYNYW